MKPLVLPLTVLLISAAACKPAPGTPVDFNHRTVPGKTLVSFSGQTLTDAELRQRFLEMSPYSRARYQTLEQKKDYVDGLVRFELLAQEAVRLGLANDPEVVETAKKVMVQQLLKKELEDKGGALNEAAVKTYYDAHLNDYVKPAMTRLAHIFFPTSERAKAEGVLAEVKKLAPLDYAGFGALARAHSQEPRTQPLEGDMRYLSDDELTAQYGAELVGPAKELKQVGDVFPTLVQTPKGLHIVKLQGRQAALNLPLEQVKVSIQNILNNDAKQQRYRQLLESLKAKSGYQVDEAALGALTVDPKAPSVEPSGPTPGFVPPPAPERTVR